MEARILYSTYPRPTEMSHFCIEPFEDEIHPRLRFAHRGIVAMANNGQKNSNDSQFIITLGFYHRTTALSIPCSHLS